MNREDEICLTLQGLINGIDYETGEVVEFSDKVKDSLRVIATTFNCRERCQQISDISESEQSKAKDWGLVSGTFKEIKQSIKNDRPNHLVIIQNGYFYEVIDEDTNFFVNNFSYKAFERKGVVVAGFPIHSQKVFSDLREMKQPFVLVSQLPKGESKKVRRAISDIYDCDEEVNIEQELKETIGLGFINEVKYKSIDNLKSKYKSEGDSFQSKYKKIEREQKKENRKKRERIKEAQRISDSRQKVNTSTKADHKRYINETWGSRSEWKTMGGRQSAINKSNKN